MQEIVQKYALEEFDGMVSILKEHNIPVVVVEDTPEPQTPDSIFPNNWFSTHSDGTLVLYPMFAPNRRLERDPATIRTIMGAAGTKRILDLSDWEDKGKFLESTGSMVLDRKGGSPMLAVLPALLRWFWMISAASWVTTRFSLTLWIVEGILSTTPTW